MLFRSEEPKPASPPPAVAKAAEVPARAVGHASQGSTASSFSSSQAKAEPAAFNPLDRPQGSFERSIAGLSIGGEALGGWEGSGGWQTQTAYTVPAPAAAASTSRAQSVSDDDDDDDRPIAQTIAARAAKRESALGEGSVSAPCHVRHPER